MTSPNRYCTRRPDQKAPPEDAAARRTWWRPLPSARRSCPYDGRSRAELPERGGIGCASGPSRSTRTACPARERSREPSEPVVRNNSGFVLRMIGSGGRGRVCPRDQVARRGVDGTATAYTESAGARARPGRRGRRARRPHPACARRVAEQEPWRRPRAPATSRQHSATPRKPPGSSRADGRGRRAAPAAAGRERPSVATRRVRGCSAGVAGARQRIGRADSRANVWPRAAGGRHDQWGRSA
jgi:hypothetical protein